MGWTKTLAREDESKLGEDGEEIISDLVLMKVTNVEVCQTELHKNKLLAHQEMLLMIVREGRRNLLSQKGGKHADSRRYAYRLVSHMIQCRRRMGENAILQSFWRRPCQGCLRRSWTCYSPGKSTHCLIQNVSWTPSVGVLCYTTRKFYQLLLFRNALRRSCR